jgi:hypothetical protein
MSHASAALSEARVRDIVRVELAGAAEQLLDAFQPLPIAAHAAESVPQARQLVSGLVDSVLHGAEPVQNFEVRADQQADQAVQSLQLLPNITALAAGLGSLCDELHQGMSLGVPAGDFEVSQLLCEFRVGLSHDASPSLVGDTPSVGERAAPGRTASGAAQPEGGQS